LKLLPTQVVRTVPGTVQFAAASSAGATAGRLDRAAMPLAVTNRMNCDGRFLIIMAFSFSLRVHTIKTPFRFGVKFRWWFFLVCFMVPERLRRDT
jgi:hypothetical protein